jgi:hypothetical protein
VQPLGACTQAARVVLDCLEQFGANRSNAVLHLLREAAEFVPGRKYPQPALAFAGGRGRAYYHRHPRGGASPDEHGHFHLFLRHESGPEPNNWAHLAALAMDRDGQPLRWFATNRWVTGGAWGERSWLLAGIAALEPAREPAIVQRWLAAMLMLFQADIDRLLTARDTGFLDRSGTCCAAAALDDRRQYELAQTPVDLVTKLVSHLTGEHA